ADNSGGFAWTAEEPFPYRSAAAARATITRAIAASATGERKRRVMGTNKMWGGRFERGPADIMEEINASIEFDKRLAAQDLAGSRAHAQMLADQDIISKDD